MIIKQKITQTKHTREDTSINVKIKGEMVDYLSRYRLYGHGYTSPERRSPIHSYRDLYHETVPHLFNMRPRTLAHDCRSESMKDLADKKVWESWVFSLGMGETYKSVDRLHNKEREFYSDGIAKPDKLLFNIGYRGRAEGDFNYPRGLAVNQDGDILIADTMNHRVQIFNMYGLFVRSFGKRGDGNGEFNEPTDVTYFPNGDVAVADQKNRRVQVFGRKREFKYSFKTVKEPYSIKSDKDFNIVVSTTARTIEIYRRGGKLVNVFSIGGVSKDRIGCQISLNNNEEVVVCDSFSCLVKYFTYNGRQLYKFQPIADGEGLSMVPSGIHVTPLGDVIIADTLNHTVNLYSERGVFLKQLVSPSDAAGSVQTCAVGPEGHLIVTEFSVSGPHCLKIFRYKSCYCHLTRPGSSKRRTPTPQAIQ